MHTPQRARRVTGRLGVAVLGALVLAVAGPAGIASAAPAAPTSITISPANASGVPGQATTYSAADQDDQDVTGSTTFSITPDGSCAANRCTPAKPGQHTVTATNGSAKASTTLRVPDRLPVAGDDTYSTTAGTPLTVAAPGVLGNDTDADNDPLTATVAAQPGNGMLSLAKDGSFTYTPNTGFEGTDRFTYRANDGRTNGNSDVATVAITVGAAPTETLTIAPATAQGTAGTPQTYTATQNGNDVTSQTTFSIEPDGSCTANACTPAAPGRHLVRARKGTAVDTATLTVANRLPVAADDAYSVVGDTVLTVPAPGVLSNDTDPDPGTRLTALAFVQPTHGTLALAPDGGFVYTPAVGYVGPDSFTYRARDGQPQGSSEATVRLTVTQPNRAPSATGDAYSTAFRTPLTVPAPGVLGNDTDPDPGTTLTAKVVTGPAHGTLALRSDGSFVYTPEAGFSGPDAFTYAASDSKLDSAPATVAITVAGPAGPVRADVAVTVTAQPGKIVVTTTNDGPFAANQVTTTVKLPAGLRVTSAPGGLVGPDGRSVVYRTATLAASRSVTSTITVAVVPATGPQQIQAAVVSLTPDPQIRNNAVVVPVRTAG